MQAQELLRFTERFSNPESFYISPDLFPHRDVIIKKGRATDVKLRGQSPIPDNPMFHIRSRYAQTGLDCHKITQLNDTDLFATLSSFHDIKLPEGIGIGNIYSPSPAIIGEQIFSLLSQEVLADDEDVVLADQNGQIMWQNGQETHKFIADQLSLIGIRVNQDVLYEVDPAVTSRVIDIDHSKSLRESVAPFLKHIDTSPYSPFVVTTTRPVALGSVHLNLKTDLYNDIYHLPSVIIKPHSEWLPLNGDQSGIRLELATKDQQPFNPNLLPEYIFFSAHL